jgi:hypothetical protein
VGYLILRHVPAAIKKKLRVLASARDASLNMTAVSLLTRAVGGFEGQATARDLSDLAGTWTEQQARELNESTRELEQIDEIAQRP